MVKETYTNHNLPIHVHPASLTLEDGKCEPHQEILGLLVNPTLLPLASYTRQNSLLPGDPLEESFPAFEVLSSSRLCGLPLDTGHQTCC